MVRRAARPRLRREKGAIVALATAPPAGRVVICRDELGPEAAKGFPGQGAVRPAAEAGAGRATQGTDDGRRGKGGVFGAFRPATGDAFTAPSPGRTIANRVAFLEEVEGGLAAEVPRVSAALDNRSTHRAQDAPLWALVHPRREVVFQPTDAASLNPIEPRWKVLRSLALKGKRFERWAEISQAAEQATAYGNAHRPPCVRGRRRRHRSRRHPGIGRLPLAA